MKRFAILTLLLGTSLFAEEKKPADAAPATPPAATTPPAADASTPVPPTGEVKVYAPTDLAALKAAKGQKVIVQGTIEAQGASKNESVRYLNFSKDYRQTISLVFFANAGGGAFTKEKLATFVGKKVKVEGTVSEHNSNLQIKVETADQVKLVE